MNNYHNPISERLEKMYKAWGQIVDEDTQLACWLMHEEDIKLYEAFCALECSEHGYLDDITIGLMTPFNSVERFSSDLIKNWITDFEAQQSKLKKKGFHREWEGVEDVKERLNTSKKEEDADLLNQAMLSFRKAMNFEEERWLNLALLPQMVSGGKAYQKWLNKVLQHELPEKCRLIVLDYFGKEHLRLLHIDLPKRCKRLPVTLHVAGAMQKIASTGEPNDPLVAFRKCLFEMGEGVKKSKHDHVVKWGEKAVEIARSTGEKVLQAVAWLTYASMLLSFKGNVDEADDLLDEGHKVIKPAVEAGNTDCVHLLLQYYACKSACCVYRKDNYGAYKWNLKQGQYAMKESLHLQAVNAFRLAAAYVAGSSRNEQENCIELAYKAGLELNDEVKEFSEFRFVALDYYENLLLAYEQEQAKEVDEIMIPMFGTDWVKTVRAQTELAKTTSSTVY